MLSELEYQGSNFAAHQLARHYHCKLCEGENTVYCSRFDLNNHVLKVHPFQCTICHKASISLAALQRHTKISHTSHCKKKRENFQSESEYKQHQKERHYLCKFKSCLEPFCSKSLWIKHHSEKHYTKANQYKCHSCSTMFLTSSRLRSHNFACHQAHKGINNVFRCRFCKSLFKTNNAMSKHRRTCSGTPKMTLVKPVTNSKKFKCGVCNKFIQVRSKERIERHMKYCLSKFCVNCNSLFSSNLMLLIHQKTCTQTAAGLDC